MADGALMLKAVLDAPDLSDYQRMFGQGVVWSRLLGPSLEQVDARGLAIIRASLEVAEAALAFREAGAARGSEGPAAVEAALRRLDAATERLEGLEPPGHADHAARTREFLEMLRGEIPAEG